MAQSAAIIDKTSIADFDLFIEGIANGKDFELADGVITLMRNPTEAHEQIAANIGAPLKLAMDGRNRRTYQGGMRVQATRQSTGFDKYKPDVMVRCGERSNETFVTDPVVVVEVLSPSTMDRERGQKLTFYKALPSLQHIVLVYSDQIRVEHYVRGPGGWEFEVLVSPVDVLDLAAVEFSIGLERVYFDLELEGPKVRLAR